jgi:hypothetical protein
VVSGRQRRLARHRARLRYETVIAWLVVPPLLITVVYIGVQFVNSLAGTPIGKALGLQ